MSKQIGLGEVRELGIAVHRWWSSAVFRARGAHSAPPIRSVRAAWVTPRNEGGVLLLVWCRATPLAADSHGRRVLSRAQGLAAMSAAEAGVALFLLHFHIHVTLVQHEYRN